MNLYTIFLLIALVLFVVATFNVAARFNLVAAELASACLAFLVQSGLFG